MRAEPRFKPLPLEAVTLLSEGRVIDAIKVVRNAQGLGLKEAKARVDAHLSQDPILRVQIEAQRSATRRKFFFWFVIVDLAITAAIIYWFFYRGSA
jgi:Ribosomal protein L7/L12 C-terminal domain